jgi:putative transport protein
MVIDIIDLLQNSDSMLIFTVLALGLLAARVQIFGIPLGSTAGILLVALLFGYWGFDLTLSSESLGFMLFIFCVGIEAGPNFFSSFLRDGVRFITLAAVVAISGVLTTLAIARFADIDSGIAAGVLAGALTSTPTLAGAQDAATRLIGEIGVEGRDALVTQIGVGYALTYVVGLVGLLIMIRVLPRIFSLDLATAARKIAIERGMEGGRNRTRRTPILRAYSVSEASAEAFGGKTLRELGIYEQSGLSVHRVKRDGKLFEPDSETTFQANDRVALVGYPASHARSRVDFGEEVFDTDLLEFEIIRSPVVVARSNAIGKELREIDLLGQHGCFADSLQRAQIPLSIEPGLRLNRGDVIELCGESGRVAAAAEALGFVAHRSHKSDLTTFASFFTLGLLIAQLSLVVGDLQITLGSAGGLLASGIVLGHLRARNPIMGHVPQGAISILKDLGLGIFMVGIGLNAGEDFVRIMLENGLVVVTVGLAIVLVPVTLSFLVGHFLLRMNTALLLGAITGSMTSTPALEILNDMARSTIPALGYAGTYTFANVFLTLGGAAIISM